MLTKSQKSGQNHKKTGEKRAIFPKRPFKRACPFKNRQLRYTGNNVEDHVEDEMKDNVEDDVEDEVKDNVEVT